MTTLSELQSTSAPFDFLAGGGEMGELIRATDWAQTPLGPLSSWSPSLKMMVRFLLANRFPLLLWWGPEFIQIYNDPYRPVLGTKHPVPGLGRPVSECWSEIWHILRPLIETPFQGGPATWMEDILLEINRYGFMEETHFTIAYSPVPDETVVSGIGGVLATVHEITEKVIGERHIVVLRDLSTRAVEAKTAEEACAVAAATFAKHPHDVPFALLYLLDPDGKQARLAGAAGTRQGTTISPLFIALDQQSDNVQGWPLAEAARTETLQIVEDLASRFGETVPPGPWADPPRQAVVTPIRSNIAHQLAGLLVVSVSARLRLDDSYRSFIELAASQVATAVANARAYEEERKRAEALAEIDRAKTEFFSNVSHEFRTPLTLMLGNLEEVLAKNGQLPADEKAQLETAHRNSLRLLKLVNTLLDFSRIEAGRQQINIELTDLSQLTAELASNFRAGIERAGMQLIVNCPPLTQPVAVDREMWEKIVLNLVSNAYKFTLAGEIEVSLTEAVEAVELRVRDTGAGIPATELPHIFERFHRVRSTEGRTYEGTGIGLALVQELVKLHDGTISVASEFGQGSTFTVVLPKRQVTPHKRKRPQGKNKILSPTAKPHNARAFVTEIESLLPEPPTATPDTPAPTEIPSSKILLADDNADMREYVRRLLVQDGYEVLAVADGEAALAGVAEQKPDLILTDVMMPHLDGFGLLANIRRDEQTRELPVILLSARAGEEAKVEGLGAGADDYLIKPFSAKELRARVQANLSLARLRRQVAEREAALRAQAEDARAESQAVLSSIHDAFSAFDRDWRYTYINEQGLRLSGLPREAFHGRRLWEVFPDLVGTEFETRLRRAVERRESLTFESYYAPWQRWLENRVYPTTDGLSLFTTDITARKQAEEALRAAMEREQALRAKPEDANRLKDEFLALVSHELKTPLNAINGWAEMLRAGQIVGEQSRQAIETIARNAKIQRQIIDDLLDVSRIITGKMRLNLRVLSLHDCIRDALKTVRPAAEAKQIHLEVSPLPDNLTLTGDYDRLQQVIWNLLSNAIKFTPVGGRVSIEAARLDTHLTLTVTDTGKGIKPEFLPYVFDRFRQEDATTKRKEGGLGLGLAIVRQIVELHGGTVSVQSAGEGRGASFTVMLPLQCQTTEPLNGVDAATEATLAFAGGNKFADLLADARVLVVDDEPDALALIRLMLEQSGASVQTAGNAAAAFALLDEWQPTLLISDIGMAGEDGYDLMRRIRARSREKGELLPAIALTAYTRTEDRVRALACGFHMHVSKPVQAEELLMVAATLLGRGRRY